MSWELSIDLGTTNTVAAVRRDGGAPEPLNLSAERRSLPSTVYLSASSVYVGDVAAAHAEEDPASYYPSPKRLLMQTPEGQLDTLRPVFSALYQEVFRRALGRFGPTVPDRVILTHPEALSGTARQLLSDAAVDAGIMEDSVILISEPFAAAAHYYRDVDLPDRILVVDVGGGTCDTAVLRADSSGAPVLMASMGDNALGGRTFDHRLAQAVAAGVDGGEPDVETMEALSLPSARRHIEQSRETLSYNETCTIDLGDALGQEFSALPWTRDHFDSVIARDVQRVAELAERTVDAAGGMNGELQICLTGGAALTPAVQQAVGEVGTLYRTDTPFDAVSLGALLAVEPVSAPVPLVSPAVTASDGPQRQALRGRWGLVAGTVVLAVLVVAVILGIVVTNQSSDDDAGQVRETQEDSFDPTPASAVALSEDSVLLDSGDLDCVGIMESAAESLRESLGQSSRPTSGGFNGVTSCSLGVGNGEPESGSVTLRTFRPNGFQEFNTSRHSDIYGAVTPAADDLPGWYRMRPYGDSGLAPSDRVFFYVEGQGWLVIESTGQEPADADAALTVARAVDPMIGMRSL